MARTQLENDIHLMAAPFRLVRNLLLVSAAILVAPLLLIWLIIASRLQPESCGIAKFPIGVFGPLIFSLWFAGIVRWCERHKDDAPALGEGHARSSGLAAYFCGIGYVGVLLSTMFGLQGTVSAWAMVMGLFSPAMFYILGRVFGIWLTKALATLQVGLTVFLFGRGFGFF